MSYVKLAVILTLVSLGASFLLYSTFNQRTLVGVSNKTASNQATALASEKVKSLFEYYQKNKDTSPIKTLNPSSELSQNFNNANFTDIFAKQFAGQVIGKNKNGPQAIDGESSLLMPDQVDIQNFLAQNQNIVDWQSLVPEIKDSDITTNENNTAKGVTDYLVSLYVDIYGTFKNLPSVDNTQNPNFVTAAQIAMTKYNETIKKMYSLSVPSMIKEFHKKELSLVIAQKNIFEKIANASNDPLGAMIAIQINQKIDEQFAELKSDFKKELASTSH